MNIKKIFYDTFIATLTKDNSKTSVIKNKNVLFYIFTTYFFVNACDN